MGKEERGMRQPGVHAFAKGRRKGKRHSGGLIQRSRIEEGKRALIGYRNHSAPGGEGKSTPKTQGGRAVDHIAKKCAPRHFKEKKGVTPLMLKRTTQEMTATIVESVKTRRNTTRP